MKRIALGATLALAGLSVGHAQQTAGEVYQWKDANGVTHYSQTPPAKGAYTQRAITHTGSAAPVVLPATAAAATTTSTPTATTTASVSSNPQCATARSNIAALEGKAAVQQDTDGDGKPDKTLSDAERSGQMELAQAAVKAYCTP